MSGMPLRLLVLLTLSVASACSATPQNDARTETPRQTPAAKLRLAVAPPLLARDGRSRFVTTPANAIQAEDVATGAVLWTLPPRFLAGTTMRWRLLLSDDGASIYVQNLSDERDLTYLGTQRVDARTGVELANDFKFEIYWYQNIVLWTALKPGGELLMAVERAAAGGGGHWLRTFDPFTLKMRMSVPQSGPPPIPAQ
jgi:hypothetical protein